MQGEIDLKRFKKLKRISKGSFGLVYQVQEKETGELYAAKIIDCDDDEEKCNEMINREVNIMMYTKHPTIIKFIGYSKIDFHDENNIAIIMELAKNGSLREVLRQIQQNDGPNNYTNTTRQIILVGIARGMKYLHNRNIIHRDIKPENILLDENLQPHITDFGLSKFFEVGHSKSQTKFGGTLLYEAPEILKKQKYDIKVDVYSFSILMFEVLTDSVPYPEILSGGMSDLEFMYKVANQGYRPKFSVPVKDSLRELIEECWSENPSDRPTFDEIFNKLANKTGDDKENFLLEDVDTDELNLYVEDVTEITDNTEKLLSKISSLEEDIKQLKSENSKLKSVNKKQSDTNKTLEEEIRQLKSEIQKLKSDNKTLEEYNKQLKNENVKLKSEDKKQLNTYKDIKGRKDIKLSFSFDESEFKSKQPEPKEKQYATTKTIIAGYDKCNLLGEKPNKKGTFGNQFIFPPLKSSLDFSSFLSYSVYCGHSVVVTRSGLLHGIGYNKDGRISNSLTIAEINQFSEFLIKDNEFHKLAPISAVCSQFRTLYMLSKSSGRGKHLVYCDCKILGGTPVFLSIGNVEPVSLFGGCDHVAAITDKGEVIFINRDAVFKSPNSRIAPVSLPDGEKASSVACLYDSIVVLSSNSRVYSSSIESGSNVLKFLPVSELSRLKIIWVSGTHEHCLAVTSDGRVFGRGSNYNGELGLGKETYSVSIFTEILSLQRYKIRAAYAGWNHSLFETREGKILSCGSNKYGELLLLGQCNEKVYSPKETVINGGATFCIAGYDLSVVFVGGDPPPNTPNMPIQHL